MKNAILASAALATLITSCGGGGEKKTYSKLAEGEQKIVCSADKLPDGWVIIGHDESLIAQATEVSNTPTIAL